MAGVSVSELKHGMQIKHPMTDALLVYIGHNTFRFDGKTRIRIHVKEGRTLSFDIPDDGTVEVAPKNDD